MVREKKKRHLVRWIVILAAIVIMCLLPLFLKSEYYLHLINITLIWVVLTSGLNIIQGFAGYVSLCQIAFYGLGAYTSGLLMSKFGWSLPAGLIAAVVVGLIVGTLIGIPALRTKGHYFSIATLAFTMLVYTVMKNWYTVTGGEHGFALPAIKGSIFGYPLASKQGYFYIVFLFAVLVLIFAARLMKSKTGRAIISLRENENLAKAVGINTVMVKTLAFNISAVIGCIAGVLYAHYMNYVNPSAFASGVGMNAILAVMAGGCGTILGPVLGSAIIIFLPELLRAAELYRQLVFGALLLVIVFLLPNGLIPAISTLIKKRFAPNSKQPAASSTQ